MEAREALLDRVSAAGGDTEIKDPATGAVIGRHTFGTAEDVKAAVDKAAAAQPAWAALTDEERVSYLMRCADATAAHAEELAWGAFINNGQTCAALKRLYVPDEIYDQVVDALAAFTAKIPMGVGLDDANLLGPLQNEMQWNVVNRLVEDARQRGATMVVGGNPDVGRPGWFYPKTLVTDIDNDAPLVQEEQFGPALPIIRYTDLEQAVEWANAVEVGLGASVWSADRDRAKQIAARLEAGTVWINGHGAIHPMIPFGGAKKSGYGLEFGVDGLKSVAVPQVISG